MTGSSFRTMIGPGCYSHIRGEFHRSERGTRAADGTPWYDWSVWACDLDGLRVTFIAGSDACGFDDAFAAAEAATFAARSAYFYGMSSKDFRQVVRKK